MEKEIEGNANYRFTRQTGPYREGLVLLTNEYGNCSNLSQFAKPILEAFLEDGRIEQFHLKKEVSPINPELVEGIINLLSAADKHFAEGQIALNAAKFKIGQLIP